MEKINIRDEYIKLGQVMKLAGFVDSGVDAKNMIAEGKVKVNGQVELQRGKKLYDGDTFSFQNKTVMISSALK